MKKATKTAISFLLALALVVSLAPVLPAQAAGLPAAAQTAIDTATQLEAAVKTAAEASETPANCPVCGTPVTWTEITATTTAISGHCKVTGDVEVAGLTVANGACVLLKGNLTSTGATFNVTGGTFNLIGYGYNVTGNGNVITCAGGTANLFGGKLMLSAGSNIVDVTSGTFNMYAGELNGENADGVRKYRGVNVASGTTCNVFGGLITRCGGNNEGNGGSIASKGTLNIYGGEISYGKGYHAGNIDNNAGTLTIYGGTIKDGVADATCNGGNIRARENLTIYGGTISGGSAKLGGGIYAEKSLTVNGGKIQGGTAEKGGNIYFKGGNTSYIFTLAGGYLGAGTATSKASSGCAWVDYEDGNGKATQMKITGGTLDGSVYCYRGGSDPTKVAISGGLILGRIVMRNTTSEQGGSYTGDKTSKHMTVTGGVFGYDPTTAQNSYLDTSAYTAYNATINGKSRYVVGTTGKSLIAVAKDGSASMIDDISAWDANAHSYIILLDDAEIADVSNIPVDLNGYMLSVEGGTVTAFDTTSVYSTEDEEYVEPWGMISGGDVDNIVEAPDGNLYLAIVDGEDATMHRLDMRISAVSLRTSECGIYFKAQYKCDETLAEAIGENGTYGIVFSVNNMPGADFKTNATNNNRWTTFTGAPNVDEATSGSIFNIMKTGLADNVARGETKIKAKAYIEYNGEIAVASQDVSYSLLTTLKAIDAKWDTYVENEQASTVKSFYTTWANEGMSDWAEEFTNIDA